MQLHRRREHGEDFRLPPGVLGPGWDVSAFIDECDHE